MIGAVLHLLQMKLSLMFVDLCITVYFTLKKSNKMQQCIKIFYFIFI